MPIRSVMAALAATLVLAPVAATAQQAAVWPQRPVTLIVPFAAGGGTDAFARPLAAVLDQQVGQRFVIENRAGAGGTLGAAVAARAPADGHTLLVGATHHAIAPSIYPRLEYDIERDFVPIAMISRPPQVVVVNPQKVQARTLRELVEAVRREPGRFSFGSAGPGTTHHLAGELFGILAGGAVRHVPYRGAGPAMQDLVAGTIDIMFDGLGSAAAQISGGNVRALAVAAPRRAEAFPDVPTAAEAGLADFEVATWYAVWAPRGTPPEVVERIRAAIRTALTAPTIAETWRRQGSDVPQLEGEAFGRFVSAEVARWRTVVDRAGVKID